MFFDFPEDNIHIIFFQIRLPRYITAFSVAVIISIAGLALQSLFKNDLAEPAILGISSAGTLGAVFGLVLAANLYENLSMYLSPMVSVLFSFTSIYLLLRLSGKRTATSNIILLGVAMNSLYGAIITIITYLNPDNQLRNIVFWGMGSFASTDITTSLLLLSLAITMFVLCYRYSRYIDVLVLSDENLFFLGYNILKIRFYIILAVAISVGVAVAFCGLVAFVGLITPHIARLVMGHQHKQLALSTPLLAICMVLLTDFICKNAFYPLELPTSVVTSFIGVPFFIHLIYQSQKKKIDY